MKKTPIKLAAIFVVLLLILILASRRGEEVSKGGEPLFSLSANDVDMIEIAGKDTVELKKQSGRWHITSPLSYRADQNVVETLLRNLEDLKSDGIISTKIERRSEYGVDSTGSHVRVVGGGNELASFIVGSPSRNYTHSYVRKSGADEIYLARGVLNRIYDKELTDWRDKTILESPGEDITGVSIDGMKGAYALLLEDNMWVLHTENKTEPADTNKVEDIVSYLAGFKGSGFPDEGETLDLKPENADVQIKVSYISGEEHLLSFFGDIDEDSNFWALKDDDQTIYKLYKSRVVKFYREADHFRPLKEESE